MQKLAIILVLAVSMFLMLGCVSQPPAAPPSVPSPSEPPVLGGDKDAHGCIGTAGYTWCEAKQKCLREWEENCTVASPAVGNGTVAPPATGNGTVAPPTFGNGTDSHGCNVSDGYVWCPDKSKCLRTREENCSSLLALGLEMQAKSYCGNGSAVYICGEYIRVVSDMPGAGSKFYALGGAPDPVATCPLVAPSAMSEQCALLLTGNNCVEKQVKCPPAAITDLKDDPNFVGAQLSWSAPGSSIADYAIYREDESLKVLDRIMVTNQTSYDDVFNGTDKTFAYFVRSRDADGVESSKSNVVYVKQLSTANQPSPGQID